MSKNPLNHVLDRFGKSEMEQPRPAPKRVKKPARKKAAKKRATK